MKMVYLDCFAQSFCSVGGVVVGTIFYFYVWFFIFRKDIPKMKAIFWEFVTYWNEKRDRELSDDGK